MKVIINGRFLVHRTTGVERYAREILLELDKMIKPHELQMAVPPETENIPKYKNIDVIKVGKLHNQLWEHISFPMYVKKQKGISLNLCNVAPIISPDIVCIHDMKIKAKPEFFSWKFRLWYSILLKNETKRSKLIITVSEFSKSEIIKYYKVDSNKIVVVPNAWQHFDRIGYDENTLKKYELEAGKYYFAMGSMEPNKNFKWIAENANANQEKVFAIAGVINEKVFTNGMGFNCPKNMKLLGYVKDEEAKTLMRDCEAFLFPSIYEGFGIPPLEAMSAGCKHIIVSDIDVMHEIFNGSVDYIDGTSKSTEQREIYGKKVLSNYSWKKSASLILDMLHNSCLEIR